MSGVLVQADYYPPKLSLYVPAMQYAADVVHGGISEFSLGRPAAASVSDIINALSIATGAVDVTAVASDGVSTATLLGKVTTEARYGRTVNIVNSGTSAKTVTIHGRDYLGAPMQETFTISTTTATTHRGKKAFKLIERITALAAAGTITIQVGWADGLGLPYKAAGLVYARENGAPVEIGNEESVQSGTSNVDLNTDGVNFVAPFDGFLVGTSGTITTAVATGAAAMSCTVNGAAQANGNFTVPVAAAGFTFGNRLTPANFIAVRRGDIVRFQSDGTPTAGALNVNAHFARRAGDFVIPDTTAPATATTGDTRGLYVPAEVMSTTREIVVGLIGDSSVDSLNRGGLFGVEQFFA